MKFIGNLEFRGNEVYANVLHFESSKKSIARDLEHEKMKIAYMYTTGSLTKEEADKKLKQSDMEQTK